MSTYRIGVIGFAHGHINGLVTYFLPLPEFTFTACADLPPLTPPLSREPGTRSHVGNLVATTCNIPIYDNYMDVLDEKPNILLLTCENSRHAEIACEAMARGIHVIMEKPMVCTLREAENMARDAKFYGTKLIVNWPTTWDAGIRLAKKMTDDGAVGQPFKFHYRNKESLGPYSYGQNLSDMEKNREWWYQKATGGGAFYDYIGYGCNLSRWFLGERPVSAMAMTGNFFSQFAETEDFAAVSVRYPSAIAMLEGTWATFAGGGIPSGPIVFGETGTLVTGRLAKMVSLYLERHNDTPTKEYEAEPLPDHRSNLALELLHHLRTGEPLHESLDLPVNLDAMAALDAAHRAAETGQTAYVNREFEP